MLTRVISHILLYLEGNTYNIYIYIIFAILGGQYISYIYIIFAVLGGQYRGNIPVKIGHISPAKGRQDTEVETRIFPP